MGAQSFQNRVEGTDAKQAFRKALDQARYQYGHRGYTGSIAEKHEFEMIEVPAGKTPEEFINGIEIWDMDKWGPAGCVDMQDGTFYFFGTASS